MKKIIFFIATFIMLGYNSQAQLFGEQNALNVPLMHQLIENNKTEHGKQTDVKNQQAQNTAIEAGNRTLMKDVKNKYRTLQERFAKMSIVFDAVNIGISATPLVKEIIKSQQRIVFLAQDDPILIPVALDTEFLFVEKSTSLVNYLIGLCAVIGDVNQMKVADRRILFMHIIDELKTISYMSGNVVRAMVAQKRKTSNANPFADYVNREEALANEIMNNVKILKQ